MTIFCWNVDSNSSWSTLIQFSRIWHYFGWQDWQLVYAFLNILKHMIISEALLWNIEYSSLGSLLLLLKEFVCFFMDRSLISLKAFYVFSLHSAAKWITLIFYKDVVVHLSYFIYNCNLHHCLSIFPLTSYRLYFLI